mgnify:CR=1 FL=1|tara:strand:- start:541 stop:765 length:225 start_codon:yes stop_codon:yes gene_type:complete
MKLTNQAVGALMMALQKSLMEQSDIVPMLMEMNFQIDPEDSSQSTLTVTNPPVVSLDGVTPEFTIEEKEGDTNA